MKQEPQLLQTEIAISFVLRGGVILCGAVISLGILLTWLTPQALQQFTEHTLPALASGGMVGDEGIPKTVSAFVSGLAALNPAAVTAVGLLLLILLPIVRVALTVILFLLERDFVYFFITLFVLATLLSSLLLGKAL